MIFTVHYTYLDRPGTGCRQSPFSQHHQEKRALLRRWRPSAVTSRTKAGASPTLAAGPMSAWQARLGGRFAGGSIAADLPIALPARTISSRSRDSARHLMPPIGLSRSFSQVSPGELARSKLKPAWSRFFASVGQGRRLSFAEVHRLRSTPYADSEKMQEPSTSDLWAGLCASHSIHRV